MIIGTCGFGSTGSSVISDYLCEYKDVNIQVLDDIEFTWVSGTDGLIDLAFQIMNPHNRTNGSITAINRYLEYMLKKEPYFVKSGRINKDAFEKSTYDFIEKITTVKWNWYYDSKQKSKLRREIERGLLQARIIPYLEKKKGRQIFCYPMVEVRLASMPSNFYEAARLHVKEILKALGADISKTIVLDQPFSGNNPQACFPFFEDPYAIVVDRDPRDNYVFGKTRLLGRNHFMAIDNVEDFVKYYRAIRENQPYRIPHDRVLNLKFESLVYDYDKSTEQLRDFLHLGENPNPKSIFDPLLSINNTQVWKRFPQYQKDIEYIEKELEEFLFDFDKYGDITPTGEMFFGKSPLHK